MLIPSFVDGFETGIDGFGGAATGGHIEGTSFVK